MRQAIPLSERKYDLLFLVFWVVNLTFITYIGIICATATSATASVKKHE